MSDKHNIDQLFQQELSQRRVTPQAASWDKLAGALGSEKKTGKHYTIYYRALKVAAIVFLVLLPQAIFWNYDYTISSNRIEFDLTQNQERINNNILEKIDDNIQSNPKKSDNQTIAANIRTTKASVNLTVDTIKGQSGKNITSLSTEYLLETAVIKPLELVTISNRQLDYKLVEVPQYILPSNDVKVIINLAELGETPSEEEKSKSAIGKFWKKLKELPIGESD